MLRVGLHPSDGLLSGKDLVAGPFHPSFREMVETLRWKRILETLEPMTNKHVKIRVPPAELNWAIGYRGANRRMLEKIFAKVGFIPDEKLEGKTFRSVITA